MNLEKAIKIAVDAHTGQFDKGNNPYILHPLRVMLSLDKEEEQIVGILHDVVEDCDDWTYERLQSVGFSENILDALKERQQDFSKKKRNLNPHLRKIK